MSIHASIQEIVRQWGEQQPEGQYPDPDGTAREMTDDFRAEILNEQDMDDQETLGEAAAMYRNLRDAIVGTMGDPNDWDGDGDEGSILANYVRWLTRKEEDAAADHFMEAARLLTDTGQSDEAVAVLENAAAVIRDRLEQNGFFLPKATYQRARWQFQCLAVTPEPFTGDTVAVGFLFRGEDGASSIHRMRQEDWDLGEWLLVETVQL